MVVPLDPAASAIAIAKDIFAIIEFAIRIAKRDTPQMRELVDATVVLGFQLTRAQDSLTTVRDCLMPFMKTDGVAGQAAAQMATDMQMNKRVQVLHDHISSLKSLLETAQLELEDYSRWDLVLLGITPGAKDRKVTPLDDGRRKLAHLTECVDQGMKAVRETYMSLSDRVTHNPIVFNELLGSTTTSVEKDFFDKPFRLQLHPTSHLAGDLLQLLSSKPALDDLQSMLTRCGQAWVTCELNALANKGVDGLERVEKSHRTLVSCLHDALEEWGTGFEDLTEGVEEEALVVKEKLVEWFVTSCRRYLALTLAIGGRVSEGKSSLLNAIIGQKLLPTDKVVETAVPCCIRHVAGQKQPILQLPHVTPYTNTLNQFRRIKPGESETASAYSGYQQKLLENLKSDKGKIIASRLSDPSYNIPEKVEGVQSIRELLALLNFLTRFSIITCDEIDPGTPDQWPLLTVEFKGLMAFRGPAAKLQRISGHFQFLDCPGYNENEGAGEQSNETDRFKRLMRSAALSADAVVPVISLPTWTKGMKDSQGYFRKEWAEQISAVVVTKITDRNVETDQKKVLALDTWGSEDRFNDVLCCDSLWGLGGLQLRDSLEEGQDVATRFKDKDDPISELSLYQPGLQDALDSISKADWSSVANRNLKRSGIESAFDLLASHSIRRAQIRRLAIFDELVPEHMRALLEKLNYQMTIKRANDNDLNNSRQAAANARKDMQVAIQMWGRDNEKACEAYKDKVKERLKSKEKEIKSEIRDITKRLNHDMATRGRKSVIQWESREQAQEFFKTVIGDTQLHLKNGETAIEEDVKELASRCRTGLLTLLQKIAERKVTNRSLLAIINAKIACLKEPTSVLYSEMHVQIAKPGHNERWKEIDLSRDLVQKFVDTFSKKHWLQGPTALAKGLVRSIKNGSSDRHSVLSTSSSAPLSRIGAATDASSSQQSLLRIPEPEQQPTVSEMITSQAGEYVIGGSFTLDAPSGEPELSPLIADASPDLDCRDICSSSAKLDEYVSKNVVDPYLKDVRRKITHLTDTLLHNMEKVYEETILGVMTEYEDAIKKEEDERERTPEDQRVRSTLAQLQLWANVTAAVSAIDALTKARVKSLEKPGDIRSPVASHLSS